MKNCCGILSLSDNIHEDRGQGFSCKNRSCPLCESLFNWIAKWSSSISLFENPFPYYFFSQSVNQRAGVALDFHMGESSAPSVQSFNCSVAVAMIQSVFLGDYEESVNKQNVADYYSFLNWTFQMSQKKKKRKHGVKGQSGVASYPKLFSYTTKGYRWLPLALPKANSVRSHRSKTQ